MWMLLPAISLAIVQIAGDNIAVVPDIAATLGSTIISTVIISYIFFGSILTGISAWIGVHTRQELTIAVKKTLGYPGKTALALIILAISIPASAITGVYFSGWTLHMLTGLPHEVAAILCLVFFSFMALGYGYELLKLSNYLALLLVPILLLLFFLHDLKMPVWSLDWGIINWPLVFALIGYNAGGIRPVLMVETAALLAKKGEKVVLLAVVSKLIEGLLTVGVAQLALLTDLSGPLVLSKIAASSLGTNGVFIFNLVLLCTFLNTMAPAMMVNTRQIGMLTGLALWPSHVVAVTAVYLCSLAPVSTLLIAMSMTGFASVSFILYMAWSIYRKRIRTSL